MKPLLVGETNPYQADPRFAQLYALYPDPPGCAGWRLCKLIMQLEPDDYLARFDRVNLCDGKWGMREARGRAVEIRSGERRPVVLLGAKVCSAFAELFEPFRAKRSVLRDDNYTTVLDDRTIVILPHPSGLSRAWNEPGAFERARAVLREAGVL